MPDDSGAVIAEDKTDGLAPFLGLHYPASDIPAQARALYLRCPLRLIPDVQYRPAPLMPEVDPRTGSALDMSFCSLRSVSPVHLEYLRNMGVAASMSISIICGNRLWGLIACHHTLPHYPGTELRAACELFGQIFSHHLAAKLEAEAANRRIGARRLQDDLVRRVSMTSRIGPELAGVPTLLDLVGANGAAVWFEGDLHTVGTVPPRELIKDLVAWLNRSEAPVFETAHLAGAFPAALPSVAEASGLLAVSISRESHDCVLWFRPEVGHTVSWDGIPQKNVEVGPEGPRLTPRRSFEVWREEVRSRATPWDPVEIEAAQGLRVALQEIVLRQTTIVQREREAAALRQNLLMAELDHRVKNTLATIQVLVHQTRTGKTSLDAFADALESRIGAMASAHSLLAANRWQGVTVRSLVEEELAPFRTSAPNRLTMAGDEFTLTSKAAFSLSLVLHELATNAVKYGALSNLDGGVDITWQIDCESRRLIVDWRERNGPPVTTPTRRGFGLVVIERSLGHELKGTTALRFCPDGLVCTISVPAEHLVANRPGLR